MAETRASKQLTRDQFAIIAGPEKGQHQRITALEDLVASVNSDPTEAVSSPVSGNTTYTISNVIGFQSILIRKANLVASAGGPFTLTITTGSGDVVYVPIAAFGDTILSGDLLFDVYVDSSGNVISKDWVISGSNTNGAYDLVMNGLCMEKGVSAVCATDNNSITYPWSPVSIDSILGESYGSSGTGTIINRFQLLESYTLTAAVFRSIRSDTGALSVTFTGRIMWRLDARWRT
jgi:hypothetical protein